MTTIERITALQQQAAQLDADLDVLGSKVDDVIRRVDEALNELAIVLKGFDGGDVSLN